MKLPILTTSIAIGLVLQAQAGDPKYQMTDFSKVEVHSGIEATIVEGETFAISAKAKRGSLDNLRITQLGDTLVINRREGFGLLGAGRRDRFEVSVALPELDDLLATSGASVDVNFAGAHPRHVRARSGSSIEAQGGAGVFELVASGGARLEVQELAATDVIVSSTGGSDLEVDGTCTTLTAVARSGASLRADSLACRIVEASATSGAITRVHATDSVVGAARSGGSLDVFGDPSQQDLSTGSGGAAVLN